ncbi:hypothetical protein [Hyalangium rubrum]|uniref:Uncharacterized protein n=1 Tax=Hyalangium rubrum TaxID=3103134 RepID=A0ABU5H8C5_9BACT|nr:hypothetical protein [Hyalangium sp. s54d21]MDY7229108.1 hypothetical protein [Hyalangium sp. s54d21]
MPVARNPGNTSIVDILDRVLDQGIRFEAWPRSALLTPRPPAGGVRFTVQAVETHLEHPTNSPGKTGTGA